MSAILFLIYISRAFDLIEKNNPVVTFLSFVNDLEFIAFGTSVKKISSILDIMASTILH